MDVWVRLDTGDPIVIGGAYRQWGTIPDEEAAIASFHDRCNLYTSKYKRVISLGDFNLDPTRTDLGYSRLSMANAHTRAMAAAGLHFIGPHQPTYRSYGVYGSDHRYSTLDHIYAAGSRPSVTVLQYAATDHFPVIATLPAKNSCAPHHVVKKRCLTNITEISMCQALNAEVLSTVFAMENVNEILLTITSAINDALDKVAPFKLVPVRPGKPPLFLATDTRQVMRERDKAAIRGTPAMYKALRNQATRLVRRDKLNSSRKCLDAAGGNPAKLWRLANRCLGVGTTSLPTQLEGRAGTITGDANLADTMNRFFVDKIKEIRETISNTTHPIPPATTSKFEFVPPSAGKVVKLISKLKPTTAVGADDIPVVALKRGAQVLAAPVAHLIRVSMKKGIVPQAFKLACISPIHKGKNKPTSAPSSYRPVAILPALSKVMEAAVIGPLSDYLKELLPNGQFGFRANRSASAAVAAAHGAWTKARASGNVVAIAAYDLSAAFDTLDPAMVIGKLAALGVGGSELNWFASYMSDRKQCVRYNGATSTFTSVDYGVPQGSLLGPLLFLVLVSDMPCAIGADASKDNKVGYISYADDLVTWASDKDADVAIGRLEDIARSTSSYTAANWLSLSKEKTQFMVVGSPNPPPLNIDGVAVPPTDKLELLGICFDSKLRPDPFLSAQTTALSKICGLIRRLANHLPPTDRASIAKALVRGKLGYGISTTVAPRLNQDSTINGRHSMLQRQVNNIARAVLGVKINDRIPAVDLLQMSGLPSVNRLAVYTIAFECWKAMNIRDGPGGSANPLGQLLDTSSASSSEAIPNWVPRTTRSSASGHLQPPARAAVNSFIWWAYSTWNTSPDLRQAANSHQARRAAAALVENLPL